MALSKEYDDLPWTVVFDVAKARLGYHLNMFCMSLMHAENRAAFKADERSYLNQYSMTEEQKRVILKRDWNGMLALGGDIYFTSKLGATDGLSFQQLAAKMTGRTEREYAQIWNSDLPRATFSLGSEVERSEDLADFGDLLDELGRGAECRHWRCAETAAALQLP